MKYTQPDAGGSWQHRSCDCECHGDNVVFARPYHSLEKYRCVMCLGEEAAVISAIEARMERVV